MTRPGGHIVVLVPRGAAVAARSGAFARGLVRDSKVPTGPALTVTPPSGTAFTAGVRVGEFD
ncbi:MAG: DUF397 domain-containing protein [Pseudonocardiaceae bacterium]